MLTTSWHLPRLLPMTEQGLLPSASVDEMTEPCTVAAVDLQYSKSSECSKGLCTPGNLMGQVFR